MNPSNFFFRHFAFRYLATAARIFVIVMLLAFMVDFFEFSRLAGAASGYSLLRGLTLTTLKMPATMAAIMPFVAQFAVLGLLAAAAKHSEIVILRSIGVSPFEFVVPLCCVGLFFGFVVVLGLDPFAARAAPLVRSLESQVWGKVAPDPANAPVWITSQSDDGLVVMGAQSQTDFGHELVDVTYLQFSTSGALLERIDARAATIEQGQVKFLDALRISVGEAAPDRVGSLTVAVDVSTEALRNRFVSAQEASLFDIRKMIGYAIITGDSTRALETRLWSLLFLPLLIVGMVLLSVPMAIRFERGGAASSMFGVSVLIGFAVYTINVFTTALSNSGRIWPVVAAAATPILTVSAGLLWLLIEEDG